MHPAFCGVGFVCDLMQNTRRGGRTGGIGTLPMRARAAEGGGAVFPLFGEHFVPMTPKRAASQDSGLSTHFSHCTPKQCMRITVSPVTSVTICDELCFQSHGSLPDGVSPPWGIIPSFQLNTSRCIKLSRLRSPTQICFGVLYLQPTIESRGSSLHSVSCPLRPLHFHCPSAHFLCCQPLLQSILP